MATGRLGAADVVAVTNTTVYTVPSARVGTFTLSLCNRTTGVILVRVALSATATPALTEWIEFDASLPANGILERSGLVLDATKNLVVYTSAAGVSAVAFGFEE